MRDISNALDPIPAIDRAMAAGVNLYDKFAKTDDPALRSGILLLLAHLRSARKAAE